jgi:hypothetical protein
MDSYTKFVLKSCAKTPRTQSEAFKDADYANALERPEQSDFSGFGAFCGGMLFVAVFAYGFWRTLG